MLYVGALKREYGCGDRSDHRARSERPVIDSCYCQITFNANWTSRGGVDSRNQNMNFTAS
jgi:hypothetical protein